MVGKRIDFGASHCVVDAFGSDNGTVVLAEIFAHVGVLKSAQKAKVLKDILKLAVAERRIKATHSAERVRKLLVFVDDNAAHYCRGNTWAKSACEELGIEIHVEHLPAETCAEIVAIQSRQNLLSSADAEID